MPKMLNFIQHGPSTGTPIVIAHGLFGSARNWGVISKRLSQTRPVVAVDMRNHAGSFWDDDHSYAAMARDLTAVIDHLGGPVDLIGHSMGGKAAMLATLQGASVRRLVVADIAPVGYGHTQQHLIDAMAALDLTSITTRAGADAALANYVDDPSVRAFLLQSLDIKAQRWRLNLTALSQNMPQILGFPETGPNASTQCPTLFLTGAASDYVRPEHRPKIKSLFPKARFAKLPGAGHWLHAEKPHEFEAAVRVFLGL